MALGIPKNWTPATGGLTDEQLKEKIRNLYLTKGGREPEEGAVDNWLNYIKTTPGFNINDFDKIFGSAMETEIEGLMTGLGTKMVRGEIPGYDEKQQIAAIESQYGTASEELMNQIQETAAGGGFESGGYYASIAKGRTGLEKAKIQTLADLNASLAQFKTNMALQGAGLLSGMEEKKYSRAQYEKELATYNQQLADVQSAMKKSQEEWWKPVLGATIGYGLGSLAGGLGAYAGGAIGQRLFGGTQPNIQTPVAPVYAGAGGYYGAQTTTPYTMAGMNQYYTPTKSYGREYGY